ncbi:MAG: hypothetical protein H0U79_07810 [Solirubrobacterales bacterium]|nr:hypothetical protein [Solirubrobacterales bacterium]
MATLLLALQAGAAGPVAERLRAVITLLLLAELHAVVGRGGSPAGGWDPRETATSMHSHPLDVLQHDRWI